MRSTLFLVALLAGSVPAADPPKGKPVTANKLAGESSPYLLQHAHNPVDWQPWGPEAFARAKNEGKLVFLSIGYSACHWCHVMERESFASEAIARVLNEHFVCVKVDREERPDVDDVYMTALQVTGVGGGWPLTMFLTPDGKPIFGGTYFPPDDKKVGDATAPGMTTVLRKVIDLHRDKKKELYDQADRIADMTTDELNKGSRGVALVDLNAALVKDAVGEYDLDPEDGGLGRKAAGFRGTKFPRVAALLFLLKQSAKPGNEPLAKLMTLTLDKMAQGGIYDHLGGGFHRYSTERTWTVPHFEKMLYDQAQLVELYCEAYRQKPTPAYKRVIDETLAFVARELTAPDGYFYSALDADSDGHEGTFYVWSPKELDEVLGTGADADLFRATYVPAAPNFEGKHVILRLAKFPTDDELQRLAPLKQKLFDMRAKRTRPFLDTKLITAWNGQMIAAYALAGQVLKEPRYVAVAAKAAEFVTKTMRDKDGRLLRIYAAPLGGRPTAKGAAFLDDYAFLAHGLLNLADAAPHSKWSGVASGLISDQERWFDDHRGGFYSTAHGGEKLFARGKDSYDGAQPSANGVAVRNLVRMFRASGTDGYRREAVRSLRAFAGVLKAQPTSVPLMADALDELLEMKASLDPPQEDRGAEQPDSTASASKVTVTLKPGSMADGMVSYSVHLYVAEGWHVYANPAENKDLAASATAVEVLLDGQPVTADVVYPKGTPHKDQSGAEYHVYEGKASVTFGVAYELTEKRTMSVRVKLIACDDKQCLKPSTIKAVAK